MRTRPDSPGDPHCRRSCSPGGDYSEVHQATGGVTLPCNQETGIRLSIPHPHHATRGGLEGRCSERGMVKVAPTPTVSQLGRSRDVSPARDHAPQCLGTTDCSPHQVRRLQLGNRENYCYSNAALKCIMYASTFRGGLGTVFNGGILRFL